jgi:hypothetical protein
LAGLWQDYGLVFATEVGTPLHRGNRTSRSFKPLLEKASLPPSVRFHELRHCARGSRAQSVGIRIPRLPQDLFESPGGRSLLLPNLRRQRRNRTLESRAKVVDHISDVAHCFVLSLQTTVTLCCNAEEMFTEVLPRGGLLETHGTFEHKRGLHYRTPAPHPPYSVVLLEQVLSLTQLVLGGALRLVLLPL